MTFSSVKGLTDEQKIAIMKHHDGIVFELKKDRDVLVAKQKRGHEDRRKIDEKKLNDERLNNATTLEEMKSLLTKQNERADVLEQRILNDEKKRVEDERQRTIASFVDKFVIENVVPDSLVQDAIRIKISDRLGVRDSNIVEMNGSELTGRTGDQLLAEIKADEGYSNHMIANRAKGGGSTGSAGGKGAVDKTMSREQHDSMSSGEVANFVRSGGTFVD